MSSRDMRRIIGIATVCLAMVMLLQPSITRSLAGEAEGGSNLITSIPRTMSYQGILKDSGGDPVADSVYSVTFRIFSVASGGASLWDETLPCTTSAGYFSTTFSDVNLPFDEDYWLELELGGDTLDPRQKLNMVGYAAVADTADYAHAAPAGGSSGWVDDGAVVRLETSTDNVGIGTSTPLSKLHVVADSNYGVAGTVAPTGSEDYIGMIGIVDGGSGDNTGVVGNAANGNINKGIVGEATGTGAENIGVFGYAEGGTVNWAGYFDGRVGVEENLEVQGKATIGLGHVNTGANAFVAGEFNTASGDQSTVGGGYGNTASGLQATIAGGYAGTASDDNATIGGGWHNVASGLVSTVAGGQNDTATGAFAAIGGGVGNVASNRSTVSGGASNKAYGEFSVIGGGANNTADLHYATVPGGYGNSASGWYSLAAGRRAKANHNGAFVWADDTDADFASTDTNQFLIRASGGVGIGTNSPNAAIHADGAATGNDDNIGVFGNAATGTFNRGIVGEAHGPGDENIGVYGYAEGGADNWAGYFNGDVGVAQNIEIQGKAGIGTTNPISTLEVASSDSIAAIISTDFPNPLGIALKAENNSILSATGILGSTEPTDYDEFSEYIAVHGKAIGDSISNGDFTGVRGEAFGGASNTGVKGVSEGIGVHGQGLWGIAGFAQGANSLAGYFSGDVEIYGALDVSSTSGAFIVPRMTSAQRDALTPVNGMIIYNTGTNQFNFYENGAWVTK